MTDLVLIDSAGPLVDLLTEHLIDRCWEATKLTVPGHAVREARNRYRQPPDVVIVDPEVSAGGFSGLDVAMSFLRWCPESPLVFFVQTDERGQPSPVVRAAWDALRPSSAVAKSSPLDSLLASLEAVVEGRAPELDPGLRPWLSVAPANPEHRRTLARLVRHAGHAKLWRALLASDDAPSYRRVAEHAELSVDTVKAYRDDLLDALETAGLDKPTLAEMRSFAHALRPLLATLIDD